MRRIVLGTALLLGGCVQHNFVPGPGMSLTSLEPDSAICRLFAKGEKSDFAFQASGSPKFAAASTGVAVIGYAISSSIQQTSNFNDCMEARGWRIADGPQPASVAPPVTEAAPAPPPIAEAALAPPPVTLTLPPTTELQPFTSARREFLVRAVDVPYAIADFRPPHGVFILEVGLGGAAASAGLRERDVILNFDGLPITNVGDLQRALASIEAGSTVGAYIRRDNKQKSVAIHF